MKKFVIVAAQYRLPVLVAAVLVLTLFILASAVWPFWRPSQSVLKLSSVGQTVVARFKLAPEDRHNLVVSARKMGLVWEGQDLAISLDATGSAKLKNYLPLELSLATSPSAVELWGASPIPAEWPEILSGGEEFLPQDEVFFLRGGGLTGLYGLPGKEVFADVAPVGLVGANFSDRGLGIIGVFRIRDRSDLQARLASLKNVQVNPGPGYSGVEGVAAGFSESVTDGATTYTLNQPGQVYQPTFGILGEYLVVASTPEDWRASKKVWESGVNLTASPRYQEAKKHWPAVYSGVFFLDLKAILARGDRAKEDFRPLFALDLKEEVKNLGLSAERFDLLTGAWLGNRLLLRLGISE
jgi:hypothetical protein